MNYAPRLWVVGRSDGSFMKWGAPVDEIVGPTIFFKGPCSLDFVSDYNIKSTVIQCSRLCGLLSSEKYSAFISDNPPRILYALLSLASMFSQSLAWNSMHNRKSVKSQLLIRILVEVGALESIWAIGTAWQAENMHCRKDRSALATSIFSCQMFSLRWSKPFVALYSREYFNVLPQIIF